MGEDRTVDAVIEDLAADGAISDALGGPGVAAVTELLEWKAARDRRLERWRVKDVEAFLLDHAPQQLDSAPEAVAALPPAVVRYLEWLDARGRLRGDPLDALRDRVGALADEYATRAADPSTWSPAKVMLVEMARAGVDTSDPEAVAAWIAAVDERERAARRERRTR